MPVKTTEPFDMEEMQETPEERRQRIAKEQIIKAGSVTLEKPPLEEWLGTEKIPTFEGTYEVPAPEAEQAFIPQDQGQFVMPPGMPPGMGQVGFGVSGVRAPSMGPWQEAVGERMAGLEAMQEPMAEAYAGQQGALVGLGQAQAMEAKQKADEYRRQQLEWDTLIADQKAAEQRRQDYMNQQIGKVQDQISKIESSEIDPTAWYKNPDGSNNYSRSVMGAIAIGLGALAQSRLGGPNNALQIINRAIDRDIDAQKTNLANKRAGVGMQMNMLGQMQQQLGNERAAEAATKLAMLKSAEMKFHEVATRAQGPVVKAAAMQNIEALRMEELKTKNQLTDSIKQMHVENEKTLYGARQQQYAAQMQAAAAQAKAQPKATPPGMVRISAEYEPTKEDYQKAKAMVGAYRNVRNLMKDLIAWRKEYGKEYLDREALAIANSKLNRLKSAMRKVDETGARLDAGEMEMMGLDFSMGDVNWSFHNDTITAKLDTVLKSVTDKVQQELYVRGLGLADVARPVEGFKPVEK